MDNRPIGIFDSGLGGLTALTVVQELLPEENIVYFADTGRVPYGSKTPAQLKCIARQDLDFLCEKGAKAIIAACGTVSSNAPEVLDACRVPVVDVLRPTVREAHRLAGGKSIGVIATEASIRSGAFRRALQQLQPERQVVDVACPDFVPLIEAGHTEAADPLVREAVERYLTPVRRAHCGVLILGCTHYGLIGDAIRAYLGPETRLLSASACAAQALKGLLQERELLGNGAGRQYFTSGSAEEFCALAPKILGGELRGKVESIKAWSMEA